MKYQVGDLFISGANGRGILYEMEKDLEYVIYWGDGQPTSVGYGENEIDINIRTRRWYYYPVKK